MLELEELHGVHRDVAHKAADILWPPKTSAERFIYFQMARRQMSDTDQHRFLATRREELREPAVGSPAHAEVLCVRVQQLLLDAKQTEQTVDSLRAEITEQYQEIAELKTKVPPMVTPKYASSSDSGRERSISPSTSFPDWESETPMVSELEELRAQVKHLEDLKRCDHEELHEKVEEYEKWHEYTSEERYRLSKSMVGYIKKIFKLKREIKELKHTAWLNSRTSK